MLENDPPDGQKRSLPRQPIQKDPVHGFRMTPQL